MTLAGSGGALGPRWSPVAARHFALQAWQLATATFVLHGTYDTALALVARWVSAGRPWRRGTFAGLAVGDSDLRFAWLVARLGAVGRPWRRGTLRGRLGVWRHQPSFYVAGMALLALGWIWWRLVPAGRPWHFAWQAWRLETSTFGLRGRRGAW